MYQDFPQCQTNSGCDVNKTWVLFWKCCLFVLDDISIQVFIYVLFLNHLTCTFTWTYTSFGVYVIYIHSFPSYPQPSRRGSRHLRHQQANSSKLPIAGVTRVARSARIRDCPSDSGVCHMCSETEETGDIEGYQMRVEMNSCQWHPLIITEGSMGGK